MFLAKWNGVSADNGGQDVQDLCCTIEFVGLVDQDLKHRVHGSSHHFSAWNDLSIHLVEDVLEVLALGWKLTIEEVQ